jgi:cyclohexyl-isocyanide hydratase
MTHDQQMATEQPVLQIGSLLFERLDQIDLTGPFEVLSRLSHSSYRVFGKTTAPVRDARGLTLQADATLAEAPQLDLLHVPGGFGQEALMDDGEVHEWLQSQAAGARCCWVRRACLSGDRRPHTGRRSTCCPFSARSRSTNASSWTTNSSLPPA